MVWGQWWTYIEDVAKYEQDTFGVYELGDDSKNTVYYGSGEIRSRLLDHLSKKECPMARYYRVESCTSEQECRAKEQQLLEEYKKTHAGKLPMYNEKMG